MTIAFPLQRGRLIYLPVRLRHRGQCRRQMVLDTGSALTVIHREVADEIGLELRGAPVVELTGVGGSAPAQRAAVDSVSLMGQTVTDLDVVCYAFPPALGLHGILGLNFLEHFNIRIDNDAETISFELRRNRSLA